MRRKPLKRCLRYRDSLINNQLIILTVDIFWSRTIPYY